MLDTTRMAGRERSPHKAEGRDKHDRMRKVGLRSRESWSRERAVLPVLSSFILKMYIRAIASSTISALLLKPQESPIPSRVLASSSGTLTVVYLPRGNSSHLSHFEDPIGGLAIMAALGILLGGVGFVLRTRSK